MNTILNSCEVVLCMLTCFPLISLRDSHRQTLNNGNISQLLWPTKLNSNISTLRQHYFHIYSKKAKLHTETTKLFISSRTSFQFNMVWILGCYQDQINLESWKVGREKVFFLSGKYSIKNAQKNIKTFSEIRKVS